MALTSEYVALDLAELRREAAVMKADGWRFVQTHAVNTDKGVDLYYSFMKNGAILNYRVEGVTPDKQVPSITDLFLAAFVFENEARELFGVNMTDIAIDFQGSMYAPAEAAPMTFISPEQKAAREKAKKVAAAKAAKEAKAAHAQGGQAEAGSPDGATAKSASGKRVFVMTDELRARLDAKMPTLSDEKKAKVEAALKAREEEAKAAAENPGAASSQSPAAEAPKESPKPEAAVAEKKVEVTPDPEDSVVDALLANMDAEKATKVRAALGGRADAPEKDAAGETVSEQLVDEQIEQLLGAMDQDKAAKVIEALSSKGGE